MLLTLTLEIDSQCNLDLVTLHLISLYFMKMVYKGLFVLRNLILYVTHKHVLLWSCWEHNQHPEYNICLSTSIPSWSQREK